MIGEKLKLASTSKYGVNRATIEALAAEWLVIITVIALAIHFESFFIYVLAGIIVSTRQHALLMLFHDAVHGLVADNRRLNDFLINALVGVPLLVPVHVYRSVHVSHHRHVGTEMDPERLLLYWGQPWNYRPLAAPSLFVQVVGDITGINSLVMMLRYMLFSRRGDELDLPVSRYYPELFLMFIALISATIVSLLYWPHETSVALLLWYVPYLTLTQLLQKVRSFAEHSLSEDESYAFNWQPGLIGRMTIWPYNINYHREHHANPGLSWDKLPLHVDGKTNRPGRELIAHIWSGVKT